MCRIPSVSQFLPVCFVACLTLLFALPVNAWATAGPAHFWISLYDRGSHGPEAPTIYAYNGQSIYLNIWGQPATVNGSVAPFKTLQNFSLNLVANPPSQAVSVADFLDTPDSIIVYKPVPSTVPRFEYVNDSNPINGGLVSDYSQLDVTNGAFDGIQGILGFTIKALNGTGIGGSSCQVNDSYCAMTSNGPAWLLASVKLTSIPTTGTTTYSLQIGGNGINNVGETSASTSVIFGVHGPIGGPDPTYNASVDRGVTHYGVDDPDVTIKASTGLPGDYNHNGVVDAADYTVWRDSKGRTGSSLLADGVPDGIIDILDYNLWKNSTPFGKTAPGAGSGSLDNGSAPEPASFLLLLIGMLAIFASRRVASA
jgi:PEP-CTERM motif